MAPANFLLVGNGTYLNRGCEAIVRGTMEILRHEFGDDTKVTLVSIGSAEAVRRQAENEYDPYITHLPMNWEFKRWSKLWWQRQCNKHLGTCMGAPLAVLAPHLPTADAILEIGGDNYSLDYGLPWLFVEMDRVIMKRRRPLVLWGASVGPFDKNPRFKQTMVSHLQKLSAILVRESISLEYLKQNGIRSLSSVCDPAFVMKPIEPSLAKMGIKMPCGAIGLNVSPLMARYTTNGNYDAWVAQCVEIVQAIFSAFRQQIVLIPHVTVHHSNDWLLLKAVYDKLGGPAKENTCIFPDNLTAAEIKWIISKCSVLLAARTHATIAAFSTGVPTLSFAYSVKAKGLNYDLFDSQEFCIDPHEIGSKEVIRRLETVLTCQDAVRRRLIERLPDIMRRAYSAGSILRNICESDKNMCN